MVHPDDLSDAAPVRPIVSLIALVAAAGAFTFGYDIVIRSGAVFSSTWRARMDLSAILSLKR